MYECMKQRKASISRKPFDAAVQYRYDDDDDDDPTTFDPNTAATTGTRTRHSNRQMHKILRYVIRDLIIIGAVGWLYWIIVPIMRGTFLFSRSNIPHQNLVIIFPTTPSAIDKEQPQQIPLSSHGWNILPFPNWNIFWNLPRHDNEKKNLKNVRESRPHALLPNPPDHSNSLRGKTMKQTKLSQDSRSGGDNHDDDSDSPNGPKQIRTSGISKSHTNYHRDDENKARGNGPVRTVMMHDHFQPPQSSEAPRLVHRHGSQSGRHHHRKDSQSSFLFRSNDDDSTPSLPQGQRKFPRDNNNSSSEASGSDPSLVGNKEASVDEE